MLDAQHNPTTPHFNDLRPLGPRDRECMDEVRAVLSKHGALSRFGLCLLHDHFPIAGDEILKETCDEASRTLTIKPVKRAALEKSGALFTSWNLETGEPLLGCIPWDD